MSTASQNNDNQEIDLSLISKKIGSFFEGVSSTIFEGILFLKRNLIVIGVLFVIGVSLGYYLDKTSKSYDSEIIVTPNFGSNDYLYSKIDLINSKIKNGDTIFLKGLGFKNTQKISVIEAEPIIDIYKFIDNNAANFELIKLMAEDGDLSKIVKDKLTSKNYPFHSLKIKTSKELDNKDFIEPLLNYINNSKYFALIQKETLNNVKTKVKQNDSIITQINGFLDNFKKTGESGVKSSSLVYYNDNMQLNEIIKTKDALISEQASHRLELVNYDKIIKDISVVTNIKNMQGISNKMKFIVPFLFILIFMLVVFVKSFYNRQLAKSKL